jgi:hypothetical protein
MGPLAKGTARNLDPARVDQLDETPFQSAVKPIVCARKRRRIANMWFCSGGPISRQSFKLTPAGVSQEQS